MSFIAPLLLRGRSGRGKTPLQMQRKDGVAGPGLSISAPPKRRRGDFASSSLSAAKEKESRITHCHSNPQRRAANRGLGDSGREVATGRDLVQNPKGPTPACGLFSTAWHGNFGEGTSKMPAEGQAPAGTALHGATWASWMYPKGCF